MKVRAGDVELFVGEPRLTGKRVLVGLHGGPGRDGSKLRHLLGALHDVADVIVPDQRGHGHSDLSGPERWNLAAWAADVHGLVDALGVDRPVVFGMSFGGFVAQLYAATYPGQPAGLIVLSSLPRVPDIEETVARFREVGGDEAADVVRRDWEAPTEETSAEWRRVCGPLMTRHPRDPEIVRLDEARIDTTEVTLHFDAELKTMDLRESLGAVRCPTLVLVGEHDPLVPLHLAREIVESVPAGLGELAIVPDASHGLLDDNPAETHRRIREFLAGLPGE